jgi:hypothetical protein
MTQHIQFFAHNLKKIIVALAVSAAPAAGFAQQPCAQIPPPDLRALDKPVLIYDHYIEPIKTSLAIGKAIVLPSDIAGKTKLLASLQREYMNYDEATAIALISTIKLYSVTSVNQINTDVVLKTLKVEKNDHIAEALAKSAMCAGPSLRSPVKFDISFYALNEKACRRMQRLFSPATSPDEVRVNDVVNGKCLPNGFGKNGARNQITFTYSKA